MKKEGPEEERGREEASVASGSVTSSSSRLSRSTVIIGLVSLLADISSEMIYPILPTFLTQTLRAPATVVGLIEGIAVGTASVVSGISGWISDRIRRRKPVAFVGYALTAVSRPMISLAGVWPVVLGARFADRFGKGIRTAPRDALLAESSAGDQRGLAFGFERAMDSSGAVLGPLVGLALVGWAGLEARKIFLISAIPASIAALMILAVRERRSDVVAGETSIRLSLAGTTREYKRLLIVTAVFGLANSANAFLILRAEQLGLAIGSTILAYALYNAVSSISSVPAGAASDRFGRRNLLVIGFAIYAASYAGFALASAAWLVWPLFAFYGLFPALTDGVSKALAVDTAGKAGRATAIGIYSAVVGVTQILASYIGGVLWDKVDSTATFYFGAALAGLAALLSLALLPSRLGSRP
ncbi:MAG TPA: MFS transporter [Blastocatellia bacterium]|nr:MFS transporter [Blastocatellia bacterium]